MCIFSLAPKTTQMIPRPARVAKKRPKYVKRYLGTTSELPVDFVFELYDCSNALTVSKLLDTLQVQQRVQLVQYIDMQFSSTLQAKPSNLYNFENIKLRIVLEKASEVDHVLLIILQLQQGTLEFVEPDFVNDAVEDFLEERAKESAEWENMLAFAEKMAANCLQGNKYGSSNLALVPLEILVHCFSFLHIPMLMRLCQVCKEWYKIVTCRNVVTGQFKPLVCRLASILETDTDTRPKRYDKAVLARSQQVVAVRCGNTITEVKDPFFIFDAAINLWYLNTLFVTL